MSDPHPAEFPTADGVTEVPLVGDRVEVAPTAASSDGVPPPSKRGRVVGITAAAAAIVAVALFLTSVLLDAGGDGDAASPTTIDTDGVATSITTPPTLSPLEALPPPGGAVVDGAVTDEGPHPTTSQDRALFESPPVPTYREVPDSTLREIVQYDIVGAVDQLSDDAPRRSETHYELGTSGFVLDVTIVRDPVRDRYQITTESRNQMQVAIVDNATDTTYVNPGTDNRSEIPNAEIIADSTATTINEFFDRLLLGPVRPDTFTAPSTRGRGLVDIPGVGTVRQFITNISGALVPEWQIYAFGPVFEFPDQDRPERLEYHVYVDGAGDVTQVNGASMVGDVSQLVQHRLTRLDDPNEVDLPAAPVEPTERTSPVTEPTSPVTEPTSP